MTTTALRLLSDTELLALAQQHKTAKSFWKSCGFTSYSRYSKSVKPRLDKLNFKFVQFGAATVYTKDALLKASKDAWSVSDVCRAFGVPPEGQHHFHISRTLKKFNIIITRRFNGSKPRNLDDYLVLNGPRINTPKLKARLLKAKRIKNVCNICKLKPLWRGKKLVFHLDHRNGNRKDCRLKNLRLLCPNCHSQTPTYSKVKTHLKGVEPSTSQFEAERSAN